MSTYIHYPSPSGSSSIPTYANLAAFPASGTNGELGIALDTGIIYEYRTGSSSWVQVAGPGAVLSMGTFDSGTASAAGAHIDSDQLVMQSASATRPGLVNTGVQTFAGNKTFSGSISASNFSGSSSGTNTGDVTLGTASGLSLVNQVLSLALSSSSTTGALSNTDWTTFNGKQAAGNYLTALTGDGTAAGPGSSALTLATVNSNVGTFGTATQVGIFTVNAKGLITAASNTAIQIAESQVTNLVSDLAGKQTTGNYITALTGDIAASGPGSVSSTLASTISGAKTFSTSITSPAHISSSSNPAASGVLRLASTDSIAFRNNGNSADVLLAKNTSDQLTYAGTAVLSSAGILLAAAFPALTGDVTTSAGSLATTAAATQANITTLSNTSGVAIHGTNTNNSASAGYCGEYIESNVTSPTNFPSTSTFGDATSISLTAGDWDVSFHLYVSKNSSTATVAEAGISTTTGNSSSGLTAGVNKLDQSLSTTNTDSSITIANYRMLLSGTTTVYGKLLGIYSVGNLQYLCRLSARRMR